MIMLSRAVEGVLQAFRRRRSGPPPVRSRIPLLFGAAVEYPLDVLRELRQVHRHIDATVLPDGAVWVVQWREDVARVQEGRKMLADCKRDGFQPDRTELLAAAGYELLIALQGEPRGRMFSAGYLIPILSRQMNLTASEIRAAEKKRREEANGIAQARRRVVTLNDRITSHSRSDWGWAHRGRRSVSGRTR